MLYCPGHMVFLLEKYQLFLYKYFRFLPLFPFSNEEQAKKSIFSKYQIKLFGVANLLIAFVLLWRIL